MASPYAVCEGVVSYHNDVRGGSPPLKDLHLVCAAGCVQKSLLNYFGSTLLKETEEALGDAMSDFTSPFNVGLGCLGLLASQSWSQCSAHMTPASSKMKAFNWHTTQTGVVPTWKAEAITLDNASLATVRERLTNDYYNAEEAQSEAEQLGGAEKWDYEHVSLGANLTQQMLCTDTYFARPK